MYYQVIYVQILYFNDPSAYYAFIVQAKPPPYYLFPSVTDGAIIGWDVIYLGDVSLTPVEKRKNHLVSFTTTEVTI